MKEVRIVEDSKNRYFIEEKYKTIFGKFKWRNYHINVAYFDIRGKFGAKPGVAIKKRIYLYNLKDAEYIVNNIVNQEFILHRGCKIYKVLNVDIRTIMYVHKEFIIELRDFRWYYDFTYDLLSMMKIIDNAYKHNEGAVASLYISWLEERIIETKKEKNVSDELNIRISKGGKLTAYKEVINYIKEHNF